MKKLIVLLIIMLNGISIFAQDNEYITYDEFLKIKSYFSEDGCAGIEKFLQSAKDLNVSDELNDLKIKNSHYDILCLLAGSTEFEAHGAWNAKAKRQTWTNTFPKSKKVTILSFSQPLGLRSKCKNNNTVYDITYLKQDGYLVRDIYDNATYPLDDTKPDQLCITSQLPIFKSKPRYGTLINTSDDKKTDITIYWNIYDTKTEKYKVPVGQKVRILGSIKNLTYVYYNKLTKSACNPLKFVDGCNSGWVDTNLIIEEK